jgi:L-alanine-DL-glutamate epimerase-like enolase superfamily enzyme
MHRATFLRQLTAAGLSAGFLVPYRGEARWRNPAPAQSGVTITGVEAYAFKNAFFVEIETSAGTSGWGEGDHEYPAVMVKLIDEEFRQILIGQDPFDSEYLWYRCFFRGLEGGNTGLIPGTIAAIDNALWDLKGRLLKRPVHQVLGGSGATRFRTYYSYGRASDAGFKSPDDMARIAAEAVAQGYRTVKARMQIRELNKNPEGDFTFKCIAAIRKTIGDDIELFVDFNNGYTASKAIEEGLRLYERLNVKVIEEPVSNHDYAGLRQVVEALPCDVNAGEHEYNKWQFRDLILHGNPDTLNLDVIKCAGLTECRKVAALGQCFEKEIMVHNTRPTLATAASLQLCASLTNAARVQEYSGTRLDMGLAPLFQNGLDFRDGYLHVPTTPGLGLEVNKTEMRKRRLNQ